MALDGEVARGGPTTIALPPRSTLDALVAEERRIGNPNWIRAAKERRALASEDLSSRRSSRVRAGSRPPMC